ncbi:MAG: DUF2470 domain-containing protein [Actinomycetota bacterium]
MTGDFSADEKAQMIEHMNDDHDDACLVYAQRYLDVPTARSATMTDITRSTMTLDIARDDGTSESATYTFERPLTSVEDAALFLALMVYRLDEDGEDQAP